MTEAAADSRRRDVRRGLISSFLKTVAQEDQMAAVFTGVLGDFQVGGYGLLVARGGADSQPGNARSGDRLL